MQLLNNARLAEITDGDADIEKQLLALVMDSLNSCTTRLAEINSGSRDFSEWKDVCHELKGAAGNIGAEILQDKAKAGEFVAQAEISSHFEAIKKAADELKAYLETKL